MVLISTAVAAMAGPRDAEWKRVDEAVEQGLPQTAIERLEPIIAAALADQAHAEAIKAIGRRVALEGTIQGNRAEEKIVRLEAEIEKAPVAMKPVMEAVLAHWYWEYFQQNRWRFLQRTQTASAPGPDLQTWDLARILSEIDRHFTAALADEAMLKATRVEDYDELLIPGTAPDAYRPTLFDFLANEALQFYQAGEQGALVTEEEFEVAATSPIFDDDDAFKNWILEATLPDSPKLKAIRLYQSLLRFHEADTDKSAYHDANLARLTYGQNIAFGDEKVERYKAALERFAEETAHHEISARALAALATELNAAGEPAKARDLAQRGLTAFPESAGGAMCFNLIQQIEARSAQLRTEHVWNAPWPTLDVTYRNVTKVYFRAVALVFEDYVSRSRWNFGGLGPEESRALLVATPVLEWAADLPPTADFKERVEKLPAPTSLKPGFFAIIASHEPGFGATNNQVSARPVWVSKLALMIRLRPDQGSHSGFVLDANSGEPIAGATVRLWQRDREGWLRSNSNASTDAKGLFRFSAKDSPIVALAEHDGQAVSSMEEIFAYKNERRDRTETQTVFFTDRAIYRPGQTINYKGIAVRYHHGDANYSIAARREVTVVFNDPNGQEIARSSHTTNDYGSFSGVFTAPRDRVMGRMSIQVADQTGLTWLNVEEYKRPKFLVKLEAPIDAAKLDAPVVLTGKATAYTGVGIGGAKVKWRVERGVQLPYWCWWWQPPASKAIAHGTALTDPDGAFKIEFLAEPDRSVPTQNEPVFVFRIHADVTDTSGETRSDDRTVNSGYTALRALLDANEWQTPQQLVNFTVTTSSLDGDPQSASGTVTIHSLKQPAVVQRAALSSEERWQFSAIKFGAMQPDTDPTNPDTWELGEIVAEHSFTTDATGRGQIAASLPAGIYRASLTTADRFGQQVTARKTVQVVDPIERRYGVKIPNHFTAANWSVEPGESFTALWGTGYDQGRAFVELERNGKSIDSYWTAADRTQTKIELPVDEAMRGGFTVRVTYVRENRAYFNERIVNVPWSNKLLSVKWERFRSKLIPGEKETWTAVVTGPDAKRATVEMVAGLYDASLDQFLPHQWPTAFNVFRTEYSHALSQFQNQAGHFQVIHNWTWANSRNVLWSYRAFPPEMRGEELIVLSPFSVAAASDRSHRASMSLARARIATELRDMGAATGGVSPQFAEKVSEADGYIAGLTNQAAAGAPKPDLSKVTARRNLDETAFFFPQLISGRDGEVKMVFTMPEALTEWKFLGFAHDKQLRSGFLTDNVVTSKDLMVEPNPPRFVREGDEIEFTVKVSSRSDQTQSGTVRLTFADAASQASVDAALKNQAIEQSFDVPANQSRSYSWRIAIPDGMGFLTYKAVGATATLSDGEEGFLPVLSRRILVTESLPLPIRGKTTKQFEFKKLIASGSSDTLRHQSLTVQMTSQPAWYAVMALPYLMEFPYECSEQVFNRYYANALARHIANSDPKIRRIFDLWRATPALESPLEKNQELKAVLLEETPWVRQAKSESQARKNVGLLFDANRLDEEGARALRTLSEQQLSEGLWPWFPGGRPSEYISLYITTGFGRLRHLGVEIDTAAALRAIGGLDAWMVDHYQRIQKQPHPESYVPSYTDALYLYGRSFFLTDQPVAAEHRDALEFFLRQSEKFWVNVDSRQSQAHLALALHRFNRHSTAQAIMKSLKERSVTDEQLGMFWRDHEASWWWYRAPIESQALMIEAFAEVANDMQAVENCKVWLLKQKQTQDWRTTKATADAIYSLLVRGNNLLASDSLVEVALAGKTIQPENVEVGTGFYEKTFAPGEIQPAMGKVSVTKRDDGVSWGSVHWQYLEDVAKVTPHEGTPLKLTKTLWVKETTSAGPVLKPVSGPLAVGDELVVRIELRTDRDMEFVHLKDQRGSGTEPVSVLSQYRFQDGLAYYESTRDTASHFFIDYLRKGTYVFEYSTRVQLRGQYQSGMAEIQCMYAPEFNSHSESFLLEIR